MNQYESSSQKALNVQQRAEASKVFPKELLGDWQPREKALLLEIEQLKMKLMEHNRPVIPRPTDSNSTSTNLRIKEGNAVDKHPSDTASGDAMGVEGGGIDMYDKDKEIARLRGEVYQLERLCDGYQVENEKLVVRGSRIGEC